jgi:uncharacterized phage protein (TIGR01671 family)
MEHKFRGKRIDNGEWVYGYYFMTPLTDEATGSNQEDGWFFLTGRQRHVISKDGCVYEVNPETVGMCTGLKDHTKDDIYSGDILYDRFNDQIGYVEYDEDSGMFAFYVEDIIYGFMDIDSRDYEIIGNIYDNPELLGEV